MSLSPSALQALARHPWPGNVRELKNAMDYAVATAPESTIEPWHLPDKITGGDQVADQPAPDPEAPASQRNAPLFQPIGDELRALERQRMEQALEASGGVQTRAAELISMPLRTFVLKLKQYGLVRKG
jgi:DNA-binding NtrC family response regulator